MLTYAFPEAVLRSLLPPGLLLDTYSGCGFVAIALVETHQLRPSFLPRAWGLRFFLSGYRVFTRLNGGQGALRGLYILRSDTDRWLMQLGGNLLTHYKYSPCRARLESGETWIRWTIKTAGGKADLSVTAEVGEGPAALPAASPFADWKQARRFAGPLPYTFDYERQTHSIIAVQGIRQHWEPRPVTVHLEKPPTFFNNPLFQGVEPLLANTFHLKAVSYSWRPGYRVPVAR